MGLTTIDPVAYGKLLAVELPKTIESNEEFDRTVERLEALDFADRTLTAEETALRDLLAVLIKDYDDNHFEIPDQLPHEMLQFLMEQRSLKQADLRNTGAGFRRRYRAPRHQQSSGEEAGRILSRECGSVPVEQ
jgi:antitoxin component HigA of HigAB toxin-antitoxin module